MESERERSFAAIAQPIGIGRGRSSSKQPGDEFEKASPAAIRAGRKRTFRRAMIVWPVETRLRATTATHRA
jgi:hypothetical protein